MRKIVAAGNWKMNLTPSEARAFAEQLKGFADTDEVDVIVCVPAIDILPVQEALKGTHISVGAQNMHFETKGAFTGEISAPMLKDAGVKYCVIGHSERREYFAETDETVNRKIRTAIGNGITPIVCCGESLEIREAGKTLDWVKAQIEAGYKELSAEECAATIIAYEPIWAIGTGKTATSEQAQEVCAFIRECIRSLYNDETADNLRILYGGSVNGKNAAELFSMPDIDGGLVGGASLKEDFGKIVFYNK